jgi:hypothetical protein
MSTPGEVNMNLRREVRDRHTRAQARRLAEVNSMALRQHVSIIVMSDVNVRKLNRLT